MERQGCIYLLRNLRNGKGYVGQHNNADGVERGRWAAHIRAAFDGHDHKPLYKAMRKAERELGSIGFSAEILWRGPVSQLNTKEPYYIKKFNTFIDNGCGYNLTTGGEKVALSTIAKRRLSRACQRSWDGNDARRAVISAKLTGRTVSEESKALMSKSQLARFALNPVVWTDEARAKLSATNKGKRPSDACVEASKAAHVQGRTKDKIPEAERGQRSASAYGFWAGKSAKERTAIALKSVATRRRNADLKGLMK